MSHRVCMLSDGFANSMELARFGGICQNEMAAYVRIHGTGAIWNLDGMAFTIQAVNTVGDVRKKIYERNVLNWKQRQRLENRHLEM